MHEQLIQYRKQTDGLLLFRELLAGIFPHIGAIRTPLINDLAILQLRRGDTLWDIQQRAEILETRLAYSAQPIIPTLVMQHYLDLLIQIDSIQHVIGPVYQQFQDHLDDHGADIAFPLSIQNLYKKLQKHGIKRDKILVLADPQSNSSSINPLPSTAHHMPSVHQTIIPVSPTSKPSTYTPSRSPRTSRHHSRSRSPHRRSRRYQCDICFGPHPSEKCWLRGDQFAPKWLLRNRTKYIATHPEVKPDPDVINGDPPLRKHRSPVVHNILTNDPEDEGYTTASEEEDPSPPSPPDLSYITDFPIITNTVIAPSTTEDPYALVEA